MNETRASYAVKEPNPSGIPPRWLRFLYRVAKLEPGQHLIVIAVPEKPECEPTWTFLGKGTVENQR